jgi:hypothetical protein
MNIKAGAKLHNKHHLILTDAKTGKIKQEGWAYNAILNQGFTRLIGTHFKKVSAQYRTVYGEVFGKGGWAGVTFVGSGTAAVSITDTQLGGYLDRKENSMHDAGEDISSLTAYHTRVAVWDETMLQNTAITEVGLGIDNQTTGLATRALIKDSEGNQITINKGTTDVLTIYSTVYLELSHSYGSNFAFVEGVSPYRPVSGNFLLSWLAYNGEPGWYTTPDTGNFRIMAGTNKDGISSADGAVKSEVGNTLLREPSSDLTFDTTNKSIKILSIGTGGGARFGASVANDPAGIWEIGVSCGIKYAEGVSFTTNSEMSLFRAVMPITGVWPGTTITDEELGTGDSTTVLFQTTWAPVLTGTDIVKVAGVTQTRNTDYTIDLATGEITFATAPGTGDSVTCTYGIEQIPKDSNHVLDIGFTIQFADGSV